MKIRKLKWWLTGGILAAVAAVNFRVATDKESACAQLFAENVDAKAGLVDLIIGYILGERDALNKEVYKKLDVEYHNCPDVKITNGTMLYGSEASKQLLAKLDLNVNVGTGSYHAYVEPDLKRETKITKNNAYSYRFEIILHFDKEFKVGFCHTVAKDKPEAVQSCTPFDDCSTIVKERAEAYREAHGLI